MWTLDELKWRVALLSIRYGCSPRLFAQNWPISDPSESSPLDQQSWEQLEIHWQAHRRRFREFGTNPGTYPNPLCSHGLQPRAQFFKARLAWSRLKSKRSCQFASQREADSLPGLKTRRNKSSFSSVNSRWLLDHKSRWSPRKPSIPSFELRDPSLDCDRLEMGKKNPKKWADQTVKSSDSTPPPSPPPPPPPPPPPSSLPHLWRVGLDTNLSDLDEWPFRLVFSAFSFYIIGCGLPVSDSASSAQSSSPSLPLRSSTAPAIIVECFPRWRTECQLG